MRLAVFGGSFNPVHYGHLLLAEQCREQARLDEVSFIPAAIPPHKKDQSLAADKHRLAMLQLAVAGHPAFTVSDIELQRGGVSYTVETLESIQSQRPDAELYLIMGTDSLHDLVNWRSPERICELARPVVARRAGSPPLDESIVKPLFSSSRWAEGGVIKILMPQIEISSTSIRQACREGRSIRFQTPRAVEKYLETEALYRE